MRDPDRSLQILHVGFVALLAVQDPSSCEVFKARSDFVCGDSLGKATDSLQHLVFKTTCKHPNVLECLPAGKPLAGAKVLPCLRVSSSFGRSPLPATMHFFLHTGPGL